MATSEAEMANEDNAAVRVSLRRPQAFALLFDRHYDAIWRYLCRRVGPTGADDLAGESFLRAFVKRSNYEPSPLGARPWLYGIATNLLREQARREDRQMRAYARVAQPLVDSPVYDEVDRKLDAESLRPAVVAGFARLEPQDRDTLLLLALTELGYEGIAIATGVPVGTVRSRLTAVPQDLQGELLRNEGGALVGRPSQVLDAPVRHLALGKAAKHRAGAAQRADESGALQPALEWSRRWL
jgi:RNA polymerase sigma-70 factor (ECF subfamily)